MRLLRFGLYSLIVTTLVAAVAMGTFAAVPMAYAGAIKAVAKNAISLDLHFASIKVEIFPLHISVSNVRATNFHSTEDGQSLGAPSASKAEEATLLLAETLSATIRPVQFLSGENWWQLEVADASIRLEPAPLPVASTDEAAAGSNNSAINARDALTVPHSLTMFDSIHLRRVKIIKPTDKTDRVLTVAELSLQKKEDERVTVALAGNVNGEQFSAEGTLALPSSDKATEINFRAEFLDVKFEADGSVGSDGITPGEAAFSIVVTNTKALGELFDIDFAKLTPVDLRGKLRTRTGQDWTLDMAGVMGRHPLKLSGVAQAELTQENYALSQMTFQYGNTQISGGGQIDTDTKSITVQLQSPRIDSGQVSAVLPTSEATAPKQASTPPAITNLMGWDIDASLDIDEIAHNGLVLSDVMLQLESSNTDTARGNGQPFSTALSLSIENMDAVEGLNPEQLQPWLPARLSMNITPVANLLELSSLEINLAETEATGKLTLDFASGTPSISGKLSSPHLDLNQISTTAPEDLKGAASAVDTPTRDVISDTPIDFSWMEALQLGLDINIARLGFNSVTFHNVETEIELLDKRLSLKPIRADLQAGGVRGHATIDASHSSDNLSGAALDIYLIANSITPADLGQKNEGLIDGGETDLFLNFSTQGNSPQQLATALEGEVALEIQRATVRNNLFEILGSDIVMQLLRMINPFVDRDSTTELNCAAARFNIEDGLVSSPDQIVLETSKMKIRAGGEINLTDETLNIDFVPTAREGLGVSLGNLASVVRLGGTLGKPEPVANPAGIFKSGATVGAAIATGGLSLLGQGLFDRARSRGSACGKIFENNVDIPAPIQTQESQHQ